LALQLLVGDSISAIQSAVLQLCSAEPAPQLLLTLGGTGFSPSDCTPEATGPLLHRQAPSLQQLMLAAGLQHTPLAVLSRGLAGTRGSTLIINLPGSPKAVAQCLQALAQALPHALQLMAQPE
jgi:molybdenum cofactor synthesis domain-containing protein